MPPATSYLRSPTSTWTSPHAEKIRAAQKTLSNARRDLRLLQQARIKAARPVAVVSDVLPPRQMFRHCGPCSREQLRGLLFPPPAYAEVAKECRLAEQPKAEPAAPEQPAPPPPRRRSSVLGSSVRRGARRWLKKVRQLVARMSQNVKSLFSPKLKSEMFG